MVRKNQVLIVRWYLELIDYFGDFVESFFFNSNFWAFFRIRDFSF